MEPLMDIAGVMSSTVRNEGYHYNLLEDGQAKRPWGVNDDSDSKDEGGGRGGVNNRSRNALVRKKTWRTALASVLALCVPILLPTCHMVIFYYLWGHTKKPVNKHECTCNCWDSIFKGPYEQGTPGFKHVYFNSDSTTLKMWIITVMWVLCYFEAFKRLFVLMLSKKLRWTMGILFLSSLHSHYYAWWGFWGFWNDEFYRQWYHQFFFSATEIIAAIMVLCYLDIRVPIEPIPMLIVGTIAVFHGACSAWDQFVYNVLQGKGDLHQVMRDIAFMSTDVLYIAISFFELRRIAQMKGTTVFSVLVQKTHMTIILAMFFMMYIYVLVFPS